MRTYGGFLQCVRTQYDCTNAPKCTKNPVAFCPHKIFNAQHSDISKANWGRGLSLKARGQTGDSLENVSLRTRGEGVKFIEISIYILLYNLAYFRRSYKGAGIY